MNEYGRRLTSPSFTGYHLIRVPPSRWNLILLPLRGRLDSVTHFKKREDDRENRNFIVGQLGRNHLNEVIQVNTTGSDAWCSQIIPKIVQGEEHFTPVVFLPKTYHPRLIMRKQPTNSNGETSYNGWGPYSPKISWAWETRGDWKPYHMRH